MTKLLRQIFSWHDDRLCAFESIRLSSFVLAIYVALIPIANGLSGLIGQINIINYITILYFLSSFVELIRRPEPLFRKEFIATYLFFFFTLASFFWNGKLTLSWGVRTVFTNVLIFVLASGRLYSGKEKKLFAGAIFTGALIAIVVAAVHFPSVAVRQLEIKVSKEIDPNFFCGDLFVAVAMMMTMSLNKKYHWMLFFISLLFLIVYFASSRASMIITLIMLVWWIGAAASKKRIHIPIITVLLFALLLFVLTRPAVMDFLIKGSVADLLIERTKPKTLVEDQGSGRVQIWLAAWEYFLETPARFKLFGSGLATFPEIVNYIAPGHNAPYSSHNIYINALIEGGVIGFILQLTALLQVFIHTIKKKSLFGSLALIALAWEGTALDAQFSRTFALAFVIAAIYRGGDDYEILFTTDGNNNRPCLQG